MSSFTYLQTRPVYNHSKKQKSSKRKFKRLKEKLIKFTLIMEFQIGLGFVHFSAVIIFIMKTGTYKKNNNFGPADVNNSA